MSSLNRRTRRRLAPDAQRVDLEAPTFSEPTRITNPLFPIADLSSAVLVGKLHGRPWRAETTLLPSPRPVEWNGQRIETLESQFVAYLNGRIFEVAIDHYAQADDGAVWYFGEDAFTYKRGRPADTEGTWLAGVNGPPAMIMPAHPRVGDVYRTENIPGLVFEQVTVKRVDATVDGPTGPVRGAMVGQELHMDEVALERKTFAPGYGEFFSGAGRTYEANALAIPADALSAPVPPDLRAVFGHSVQVLQAVSSSRWAAASTASAASTAAWARLSAGRMPVRLAAEADAALDAMTQAVHARKGRATAQAALAVAQACLDLELRYVPPMDVDASRFELWTRQLQVDAARGDEHAIAGDVSTLEWIRNRIPLDDAAASGVDDELRYLDAASEAGELKAAASAAARLRDALATVLPAA